MTGVQMEAVIKLHEWATQARTDIKNLVSELRAHEAMTQVYLDPEDQEVVMDIERRHGLTPEGAE